MKAIWMVSLVLTGLAQASGVMTTSTLVSSKPIPPTTEQRVLSERDLFLDKDAVSFCHGQVLALGEGEGRFGIRSSVKGMSEVACQRFLQAATTSGRPVTLDVARSIDVYSHENDGDVWETTVCAVKAQVTLESGAFIRFYGHVKPEKCVRN